MTRPVLSAVLFLIGGIAVAAPPSIQIEPVVRPSGQYVQFTPKTDAVSVEYVGLDGVEPFPSALLKDGRAFVLDASGLVKDKAYRFVAVAAGKTGEQTRASFTVVNGKTPGPGPMPPPDPMPLPDGELGLRKISREFALITSNPPRGTEAKLLAGASRTTASAVAAGAANVKGVFSPAEAMSIFRINNKAAVASDAPWETWGKAVSVGLQNSHKAGKLSTSLAWAGAFTEVADGLTDTEGK